MKKIILFLSMVLGTPTILFCMQIDESKLVAVQDVQEIPEITDALAKVHIAEPIASQITDEQHKTTSSEAKKPVPIPHNFHVVVDKELYRSAQLSQQDLEDYINKFGIQSVVNLRTTNNRAEKAAGSKASRPGKYDYFHVPMCSHCLPSIESLDYLVHIFKHAKKPILVHCAMGIDRTGEAAALYLYAIKKQRKQEALLQLSRHFGYRVKLHPAKALLIYLLPDDPGTITDWIKKTYNPYCSGWLQTAKEQFEKAYNLDNLYAPEAFLRDFQEGIDLGRLDLVFADNPEFLFAYS